MTRTAFIFPGQGAQYVGMGKSFFNTFPQSKQTYIEADDLLKENLSSIIFEGPEDVLTRTRNSQLGIFITSIAILRTLKALYPKFKPDVVSGLSLGEYSALVASGILDFKEALQLVSDRGNFMNKACLDKPGTMAAVLSLDSDIIERTLNGLNLKNDIWIANYNCPGQVVISGTVSGVEKSIEALKAAGARRVMPLQVFGAFHSGLMKSAEDNLENSLKNVHFKQGSIPIVMNVTGNYLGDISQLPTLLKQQVTHSVRWQQGIQEIEKGGPTTYYEIGCGKVLAGLNKKIGILGDTINIDNVDDLKSLEERVK